jgi:AraC family transcriptional regulator of adaptative response/methylated-DNA-[protein]-cysteine methyltransferase
MPNAITYASRVEITNPEPATADAYPIVKAAIRFLTEASGEQPDLDALAAHLGLSPFHVQRLFTRWCGLSPKAFLQAVTLDHARRMLTDHRSVLDTAHKVGLSGGSRLHDLFVTHEAVTPGDVRRRGAGLELAYGFHPTPFGEVLAVRSDRGLVSIAFVDDDLPIGGPDGRQAVLDEAKSRWPMATWRPDPIASASDITRLFAGSTEGDPVRIVMIGTDFEIRVWQLLTRIPAGHLVSYTDVAERVCSARAARAVGAAVGRNPLAFVVPCHRVVRADGGLGGYHWNLTRKRALIGWEAGRYGSTQSQPE